MNYQLAKAMFALFRCRRDIYAVQRLKKEELVYYKVTGKELTIDLLLQHLRGEEVIGVYPLLTDGTCTFACLDIDTKDYPFVCEVSALLPAPNYIERSRSGNHHVWMFFSEPLKTEKVRAVCEKGLKHARKAQRHCNLYPLPPVSEDSIGLLIALPYQGRMLPERTAFLDKEGKPLSVNCLKDLHYARAEMPSMEDVLEDGEVYKLFVGRGKTKGDRSQSGYDFSFCVACLCKGLTREEVEALLPKRPRVHSTTQDYIKRTVQRAVAWVVQEEAKDGKAGVRVYGWEDVLTISREEFHMQMQQILVFDKPQQDQMEVFFATLIANLKMGGRPIWLLFVGPPGCGKTMGMLSVAQAPYIYMVSALRPAALISGFGLKGTEDMSLIPKLNNKILFVKDMSSLLSQNKEVVAEVLGLLRDAYDGTCSRVYGTGVERSYQSRFGFIGATTPDIDANWTLNVRLGERFLRFRIRSTLDQVYAKIDKGLENLLEESEVESRLEDVCMGFLKTLLTEKAEFPKLSNAKIIGRLAQLGAILRTAVARANYSSQVLVVPEWEEATRYAKQLAKVALALAYIRGKETNDEEEMHILRQLVRDGLDSRTERLVKELYREPGLDTQEVARRVSLPSWTVRTCLQDLEISRIVQQQRQSFDLSWRLTPWIFGQVEVFKLWEK